MKTICYNTFFAFSLLAILAAVAMIHVTREPAVRPVVLQPIQEPAPVEHVEMLATWYGGAHHGRRTASGERFDREGFTAAHRTLPFGAVLHLEHEGRTVTVTVTDRGPMAHTGRDLDVSEAAAVALGMRDKGVAILKVRRG